MKRMKIFTIAIISILIVVLAGNIALALKYGDKASLNSKGKIYVPYTNTVFGPKR